MSGKSLIVCIFIIYLATRLYFLFTFPPFTDESFYIRWGQLSILNPDFRWAALQYINRQPLSIWLFGIGSLLFGHTLFGARLIVFLVNIPVFFALRSFVRRIFSEKIATYSLILLTVNPLFILTQSIAMMDGLLFAISCYILWLFFMPWSARFPKQSIAIALLLGIACWIKTTALMLVVLAVVGLIWKTIHEKLTTSQCIVSIASFLCIPVLIIVPLAIHPGADVILHEPDSFVLSIRTLSALPVTIWLRNTISVLSSLFLYFTPLAAIFLITSLPILLKRRYVLLSFWFMIPLIITIFFGKDIRVRYFVIGCIALVPLLAYGWYTLTDHIRWRPARWVLPEILGVIAIVFITAPYRFFHLFPSITDEKAYAIGGTSGYGIHELTHWIDMHVPSDRTLYLAVPDSPGNPSDYILAYYYFSPNVHVLFATLTSENEFKKLGKDTSHTPIYLATRGSLIIPPLKHYLKPVIIFPKPYQQDDIGLYEIVFPE